MADVQPYRGWRYNVEQVGDLSEVTAPPYDVIDADEQKGLYERHPCNVVRLILNRDEPGDSSPDDRYQRAADFLKQWQQEGVLIQESQPALYVYHQVFDWEGQHFVRKGFLGRIRLEEFEKGSVFPHEQTMSGPKEDRLKLMKATHMNLSPVFGLFPDPEQRAQNPLEEAIASRPPLEATDELGVLHRLWPVTDGQAIEAVHEVLAEKPIFLADGHHRYETALNYRNQLEAEGKLDGESDPANFALMMFVGMSDPGLVILPTHRLVSGLPDLTADDVREALGSNFRVESVGTGEDGARAAWKQMEAEGRQDLFGFGTAADGQWLLARLQDSSPMQELKPDQSDVWRGLGVSILHLFVLEHLLKRRFPEASPSCQYVHQLEEVTAAQSGRQCQLAALVAPAQIEHVKEIASRYEKMPPKSTYFYPKLLSGLVFNPLSGDA